MKAGLFGCLNDLTIRTKAVTTSGTVDMDRAAQIPKGRTLDLSPGKLGEILFQLSTLTYRIKERELKQDE